MTNRHVYEGDSWKNYTLAYDAENHLVEVSGAAEASFEQQRLRRAILQLGGNEQQVVILRFLEGFEFAEIASLMKKKEGNVRVILHRALAKLRSILEKERKES